jgi:hypothetical protein
MKRIVIWVLALVMAIMTFGCDEAERDEVYPEIDMTGIDAFPKDCDTVFRGETFLLKAIVTDNIELGAFSIDIHDNFDHHTHSSSGAVCEQDADKEPVNPFLFIRDYDIPGGLVVYDIEESISIPAGVDPGDYHLMVRLTDAEGWQTLKGISIKVL